jgi:hypothetical protein
MTGDARSQLLLGPDHVLRRAQLPALVVGLAGLAAAGIGAVLSPTQFFRSYLVAYLFWFGLALGSMAILMIQFVTGGRWGASIRRVLESATRTLPLMLLLFLPLMLGIGHLYEWAHPAQVARDPLLQGKSGYLNVTFFLVRAGLYFAVWLLVARLLNRWSLEQDDIREPAYSRRLENLSRGGLLLYGLTMTFASIDWVMSLEPHWFSTIYGILFVGGQVLSAFAFVIPVLVLLSDRWPLSEIISADLFHDLGKLLLAFVMLWAYFAFSQLLIIWSGNLPEEIPWYLNRLHGGWQWIGVGQIALHFALPFFVLLSRDLKRNGRLLALLAVGVVGMRFVDLYWLVTPSFEPGHLAVHVLDLLTLVGVGGVWLAAFLWQLQGRPLMPLMDPALQIEDFMTPQPSQAST